MAKMVPRVEDDCVEYFLFPRLPAVKAGNTENDTLEDARTSYRAHLSSYLNDYVWQKEGFNLNVVDKTGDFGPAHLHGITNFGCNVDDEWFVIFLLFELTKCFPDLIVRVIDADGEIILIEMADEIPEWLNPDSAENRVFIYRGNVHIIPRSSESIPKTVLSSGAIALSDALNVVRDYSFATKCDVKTQRRFVDRIERFPGSIEKNRHAAHCFVPAAVASILSAAPWFLSASANAFIERNATETKGCNAMKFFPPETRVMTRVTFPRCLYAQLLHHKYEPDRRVGWNLPPSNSSLFKAYDLGMKLACGFEILILGGKRSPLDDESGDNDPRWHHYLASLKKKGFFRGEFEGSQLYVELKRKASQYFNQDLSITNSVGDQLLSLLDSIPVDLDELKRREKCLPPADDDSWLDITGEGLESILREKWDDERDSAFASLIPSTLNSFVNHQSGVEGVEPPKLRDRNKREKKNASNRVTLDPESFGDAMNSILDFKVPDWEEGSSSDFSEYSDEENGSETLEGSGDHERTKMANKLKDYMSDMGGELAETTMGRGFAQKDATAADSDSNLDRYSPVDVDLTALCNILESYRCQQGASGPASTLLNSMGVHLPRDAEAD